MNQSKFHLISAGVNQKWGYAGALRLRIPISELNSPLPIGHGLTCLPGRLCLLHAQAGSSGHGAQAGKGG